MAAWGVGLLVLWALFQLARIGAGDEDGRGDGDGAGTASAPR
jgi:hypothetical protein